MTRTYPARLRRVIDGDTYLLDVDLGFYVTTAQRIRLRGVDTPEVVGETRAAGLAAKTYAESLLTGQQLTISSHKDERSFERWVADVALPDGRSVAQLLVEAGQAVMV